MMRKFIQGFIILNLLLSRIGYAEMYDPTRPPGDISGNTGHITAWQLDAVILSEDRKVAIINGKAVKLGEYVGPSQLVDIEPHSVQLQSVDGKITLFLLDPTIKVEK